MRALLEKEEESEKEKSGCVSSGGLVMKSGMTSEMSVKQWEEFEVCKMMWLQPSRVFNSPTDDQVGSRNLLR